MRANPSLVEPRAFVLGGNASTLAFVSSFQPEKNTIAARLVPLARTPAGVAIGDVWQNVGISPDAIVGWVDQAFSPEDPLAFVAPVREIELLARAGWSAPLPDALTEATILNLDDVPEDVADGLLHPPESIVQCAACRRLCVRDHFVWKERRLCAWDYHHTVLGTRGPWHSGAYEQRHFETIPRAEYVAPPLLAEESVEAVLGIASLDERTSLEVINTVLQRDANGSYMAVRTSDGFTLLRECREVAKPPA